MKQRVLIDWAGKSSDQQSQQSREQHTLLAEISEALFVLFVAAAHKLRCPYTAKYVGASLSTLVVVLYAFLPLPPALQWAYWGPRTGATQAGVERSGKLHPPPALSRDSRNSRPGPAVSTGYDLREALRTIGVTAAFIDELLGVPDGQPGPPQEYRI